MDIRVSFEDFASVKIPLYQAGDTIILEGEKGLFSFVTPEELRAFFKNFDKPYNLVFERIIPTNPQSMEQPEENVFGRNIISFSSYDLDMLAWYMFLNCTSC